MLLVSVITLVLCVPLVTTNISGSPLPTDQPAESVTRFKQWFWSVVEKMSNEEKHDLVRQREMGPLVSTDMLVGTVRPYSGKWGCYGVCLVVA